VADTDINDAASSKSMPVYQKQLRLPRGSAASFAQGDKYSDTDTVSDLLSAYEVTRSEPGERVIYAPLRLRDQAAQEFWQSFALMDEIPMSLFKRRLAEFFPKHVRVNRTLSSEDLKSIGNRLSRATNNSETVTLQAFSKWWGEWYDSFSLTVKRIRKMWDSGYVQGVSCTRSNVTAVLTRLPVGYGMLRLSLRNPGCLAIGIHTEAVDRIVHVKIETDREDPNSFFKLTRSDKVVRSYPTLEELVLDCHAVEKLHTGVPKSVLINSDRKNPPEMTKRNFKELEIAGHSLTVDGRYCVTDVGNMPPYGKVAFAEDLDTKAAVAIKDISQPLDNVDNLRHLLDEIKILKHFNTCKNIVKLHDIWLAQSTLSIAFRIRPSPSSLADVFEAGGHLLKPLKITYQLLCGLKFIHSANVVHNNLKPENILVDSNSNIELADFSNARSCVALRKKEYTEWYPAPESLLGAPEDSLVDIWAGGIIATKLFTGNYPFASAKTPEQQMMEYMKVLGKPTEEEVEFVTTTEGYKVLAKALDEVKDVQPSAISDKEHNALLVEMLKFNPRHRPSADKAIKNRVFNTLRSQGAEANCKVPFEFNHEQRDAEDIRSDFKREVGSWNRR